MTYTRLAVHLALLLAAPAAAKDIRVAADGSGDHKTLLKALNAAKPGDVVIVKKASGMVGLVMKEDAGGFVVEKVVSGSPSEAAGIRAGERVVAIDGVSVAGRGLPEVVGRIRGPMDTVVELKVASGAQEREVSVTRGGARYPVTDERSKLDIARNEKESEAVVAQALPLARAGDAFAASLLSNAYYWGFGVAKDLKEALRWAKTGAEGGDVYAQRMLAVLYAEGPEKEPRLAYHWMRQAAEKGDVPAMINLSSYLETGYGAPKDLSGALEWARRAQKAAADDDGRSRSASAVARLEPLVAAASGPAVPAPASAVTPAVQHLGPATPRSDVDELPARRAADPKAVALVIGVERYREALPRADFAAADARLAAEYFQRVFGVTDENLAVLVDDRATKSDFEKYVEQWLPNHVTPGAKVYVYFSGHGAPDAAKGDSYLVPFDADPTYIKQTGYSLKRLYDHLGRLPAAGVTVAMDSCFSGAGGRSVLAKGARPLVNIKADVLPAKLTVLSASGAAEISNSYQEKGHGLFTYFLLKGLKDKADFRAAYDYLAPEVSRVARRTYNSDQTPQWRQAK